MRALSISMSAGVVGMQIACPGAFTSVRRGDDTCNFPGFCTAGLFSPCNKRILLTTIAVIYNHLVLTNSICEMHDMFLSSTICNTVPFVSSRPLFSSGTLAAPEAPTPPDPPHQTPSLASLCCSRNLLRTEPNIYHHLFRIQPSTEDRCIDLFEELSRIC